MHISISCMRAVFAVYVIIAAFIAGEFSVLQVNFNLRRHTGYFLIQVYVPCILIVVLSWVSFWIHREATSDRVGLGKQPSRQG